MTILSNGHQWKYSEFIDNKDYSFDKNKILKSISKNDIDDAYDIISKWEGYSPTPLLSLNKLSNELNLKNIFYKDENKRFDLKSFKALGGAYAVEKVTKGNKDIVVATATAGNHGRSVSWGARRLGLKCKIFISEFVSEARGKAMSDLGADVIKVKGNYEQSLIECIKQSTENNWQIVQDVAWKDYMIVPKYTMAGYSVMMREIIDQINNESITHVFLQAGVGGMAAAMIAGFAKFSNYVPKFIIVEPENADCVFKSIQNNRPTTVNIKKETIMGGMSCGDVSSVAWEILKKSSNYGLTITDSAISTAVAMLASARFSDKKIVGGECAVPGIIALISLFKNAEYINKLSYFRKVVKKINYQENYPS